MDEAQMMDRALDLAEAGLGTVWPNPSVGALVVAQGRVVGEGRTQLRGRPHAEVVALKAAGGASAGATVYVSLEPCCHWGQTPPCTDALIRAQVARVVVCCLDPDPRVNGAGVRRLQKAGVEVSVGLHADRGRAINAGFFTRVQQGRPWICAERADAGVPPGYDAAWLTDEELVVRVGERAHERWAIEAEETRATDAHRTFWLSRPPSTAQGLQDALRQLGEAGLTRLALRAPSVVSAARDLGVIDEESDPEGDG